MRIAQILNNKAHWIFEDETLPILPPDISGNDLVFINITDKLYVEEGWNYNSKTGEFTKPIAETIEVPVEELSIEEQILYETQYQTTILEMGGM